MIGISLFGIREAVLMFAVGFGYIICYLAKKQDKGMQSLGHLIGMGIIVLSSILLLINIYGWLNLRVYKQVMSSYINRPITKGSMMGQGKIQPPPVKK